MTMPCTDSTGKKCLRLFGSAAIVFTLACGAASPAKADVCGSIAGNAVRNCGFESGDFTGWALSGNLQGGPAPNSFYGVDGTFPNSGTYEGYFGVQGGGGTAIGTLGPFLALTQTLDLKPAEYYSLGFYLDQNGPNPSDAPGYVNYFDARFNGAKVTSRVDAPNSGGVYQSYSFVVSTPSDATAAHTLLQFNFQNDSDVFYFDDVHVTAIAPIPEPASILLVSPILAALYLLRRKRS